jgi:hypothetical protein
MVFGQEKVETYVLGTVGGQLVTANFGNNDRVLFLLMGAALAEIQSFEFLVVHVLSLIAAQSDNIKSENLDTLLEENFEKCMGPLIKAVRKHCNNPAYAPTLECALQNRNLFIHRFLRQHAWPMDNDDDYLKAIRHVQDIRKSIWDANTIAHRILAEKELNGVVVIEFDPEAGFKELSGFH